MTAVLEEIKRLSISQRILLAQDIWDWISDQPEAAALTDAQLRDLDARLDDLDRNPTAGSSWQDVRQRLMGK